MVAFLSTIFINTVVEFRSSRDGFAWIGGSCAALLCGSRGKALGLSGG